MGLNAEQLFACFRKEFDGWKAEEEEDWQFLKCFLAPITNPNLVMSFLKMHTTTHQVSPTNQNDNRF